MQYVLERHGFEVLTACNGEEALRTLKQVIAGLLITDWELPGMTGIDLIRAVRDGDLPGMCISSCLQVVTHTGK